MKYPFFASFIVLCLLLMYEIHKVRNKEAKIYQSFLDEETKANNTRKQSLDNLEYIKIPISSLPVETLDGDEKVKEFIETLTILSSEKIVNFTGFSNTELKMQYGAANLEILSRYDNAYTSLVRTLNAWGHYLYEKDYVSEAQSVLEYAISIHSDIGATYDLLSKIYLESNHPEKIKELIPVASEINSLSRNNIVKKLESYTIS